jgi:metallo-beta-lactamase family protein
MTADGVRLTFWGAAGTVTGSKFLLERGPARVLVDCGLFQGPKVWRQRNWEVPPRVADGLDAVVLTHAHLDHSGFLPRLTALAGGNPAWRAYATPATADLCRVLLPDSAHIQEEDAAYANKKGFSKHRPALPLYTAADAYAALRLLRTRGYGDRWGVAPGIGAEFADAGHLLGSATVRFTLDGKDGARQIVFSGDLGRYVNPLLRDPTPPGDADVVVMESTYGGRHHSPEPPDDVLAGAVHEAVRSGGCLLIPAFAVGRTQDLLYALRDLTVAKRVPALPIYVDSPMAIEATRLFLAHEEAQDPELAHHKEALRWSLAGNVHFVHTRFESQALNDLREPAIILAASGMATGGRILHHLKHRLPDRRTVVLLAGYQAEDTRGRLLLEGATRLKIHGEQVPVRAKVRCVDGFSAHGDQAELLRWLGGLTRPPRRLFLVHGEPESAAALGVAIKERYGYTAEIASYGDTVSL